MCARRLLAISVLLAACSRERATTPAPWALLADLQRIYGPLITAGNHPTPDQHGTGERLGLFRDASGRVWGLPLTISKTGEILGCAPTDLRNAQVTDTIPAGLTVVGATNEPTGWRGGTGKLELLLRDRGGELHVQSVSGGEIATGPVCQAPELPGPPQKLQYYLIVPGPEAK